MTATATVTVTHYHLCSFGASGSAMGPYNRLTYWWADRGGMMRLVSDPLMTAGDRELIEAAILATITVPADVIRRRQDEAAEALD